MDLLSAFYASSMVFIAPARLSHLKIPGRPKMACTALCRRAMHGRPQEVLCSAYFLLYNGIGAL